MTAPAPDDSNVFVEWLEAEYEKHTREMWTIHIRTAGETEWKHPRSTYEPTFRGCVEHLLSVARGWERKANRTVEFPDDEECMRLCRDGIAVREIKLIQVT